MKLTPTVALLGLFAALSFTTGCASNTSTASSENEDKAKCLAPKAGTVTSVNSSCAIMNDEPVDPAVPAAEWKGQKVGFCCAGCIAKWEKLSPEKKDAALAAAVAASSVK